MWAFPVSSDDRLSAGTLRWSSPDGSFATIVAKLTLSLDANDKAQVVSPGPLLVRDEIADSRIGHRVWHAADMAPFTSSVDVVLRGSAWQAGGAAGSTRAVRLGVYRGHTPLLSKVLHVYGDRTAASPRNIQPFTSMPIVWERAVGDAVNPLGAGLRGPENLPNVIHPQSPTTAACFGPIPRFWPVRERLAQRLSGEEVDSLNARLPAGFNYDYYQCAPADQRISQLIGDEWIVLEGMHAARPSISTQLPSVSAVAKAVPASNAPAINMKLALLAIDMDALTMSLTFRGTARVMPSEPVGFVVTLNQNGVLAPWPAPPEPSLPAETAFVHVSSSMSSTLPINDDDHAAARRRAIAPFAVDAPRPGTRAIVPGAPWHKQASVTLEDKVVPAIAADETLAIHAPSSELPAFMVEPAPPIADSAGAAAPSGKPVNIVVTAEPAKASTPAQEPASAPASPRPLKRRERTPRTIETLETELLQRGLAREDVAQILAAIKA